MTGQKPLIALALVLLVRNGLILASKNDAAYISTDPKTIPKKEGDSFEIKCTISYAFKKSKMCWTFPNSSTVCENNKTADFKKVYNSQTGENNFEFEIRNAKRTDTGNYLCTLLDNDTVRSTTSVRIYGLHELPPQPRISNNFDDILFGHNISTTCYTNVSTNSLQWILPENSKAKSENRTNKSKDGQNQLTLTIWNVTETDKGTYSCLSSNPANGMSSTADIQVNNIYEKPGAYLDLSSFFVEPNHNVTQTCKIAHFNSTGNFTWFYNECGTDRTVKFPNINTCSPWTEIEEDQECDDPQSDLQTDCVTFTPKLSGQIQCVYTYESVKFSATAIVYIQDKDHELVVEYEKMPIFRGNATSIRCFASMAVFNGSIQIQRNGVEFTSSSEIYVFHNDTDTMYVVEIQFTEIALHDAGTYTFVCNTFDNQTKAQSVEIVVNESPRIQRASTSNEPEDVEVNISLDHELKCEVDGFPEPNVQWLKDNMTPNNSNIIINGTSLKIHRAIKIDSGIYTCFAQNLHGIASQSFAVRVMDSPVFFSKAAISIVVIVLVILTILFIVSFVCYRREREKYLAQKRTGILHFLEGNEKELNHDLAITQQADLLPYDIKYDFPGKDLVLERRLGAGVGGEVFLAKAKGIFKERPIAIDVVAVKRVRNTAMDDDIRALISELKIMIFLGKHLNVLNLLGVVRENLNERKLLVITEYCVFGNLRDYLRRNRERFVDEFNLATSLVDISPTKDFVDNSQTSTQIQIVENEHDCEDSGHDETSVSISPEASERRRICTTDLICWSYQVAQGMNYLARQGVLHGDLAARNILLADDNVVKICDFGFSRWLRPEHDYTKESDVPLPLKWMAIESIENKIYNTSSDIWSYGVLIWEIFSLGDAPYAEIFDFQSQFFPKLKSGYRLGKPYYCHDELYDIMVDCWNISPQDRPRFDTIANRLSAFLSNEIRQDFQDRNAEYMKINVKSGNVFDQMNSPDKIAPIAPPKYVRDYDIELAPISSEK